MSIVDKAKHHRAEADRLLLEATSLADDKQYEAAQTVLELSEAHLDAMNRAEIDFTVGDIENHLGSAD